MTMHELEAALRGGGVRVRIRDVRFRVGIVGGFGGDEIA